LIQTFADIGHGELPVDFFHRLGVYFERTECTKGSIIYREGDSCDFLLVLEQGSLRSLMDILKQQVTVETLLAGSVAGELGMFLSSPVRTRSLLAEQDSVYWKLTRTSFDRMCTDDPQMAHQFMLLTLYFSSERLDTMTRHAFHLY
jgi:SulP family sulfate permease